MARDITITTKYPILNGYVQYPPCLEGSKTATEPASDADIIYSKAGDFYEVETEVL